MMMLEFALHTEQFFVTGRTPEQFGILSLESLSKRRESSGPNILTMFGHQTLSLQVKQSCALQSRKNAQDDEI